MALDTAARRGGGASGPEPQLPPAPPGAPRSLRIRPRRRPLLFAVTVALVATGALVGAFAFKSVSDTQSVLAVRDTVMRGEIIGEGALMVVRVGIDPALETVAPRQAGELVGRRASMDLAAGSLLTPAAVTDVVAPAQGLSLVGIGLTDVQMPSQTLLSGDRVRIVVTPSDEPSTSSPESVAATVVAVHRVEESGLTVVDVSVPANAAPGLAVEAAAGQVALVLDSRER